MLDFMRNGGWPMWPILVLGVCAIAFSLRDTLIEGEVGRQAKRLAAATISAAVSATLLDLMTVFLQAPRLDTPTINVGVGESLTPAILGFALLTVGQLVLAFAPALRPKA